MKRKLEELETNGDLGNDNDDDLSADEDEKKFLEKPAKKEQKSKTKFDDLSEDDDEDGNPTKDDVSKLMSDLAKDLEDDDNEEQFVRTKKVVGKKQQQQQKSMNKRKAPMNAEDEDEFEGVSYEKKMPQTSAPSSSKQSANGKKKSRQSFESQDDLESNFVVSKNKRAKTK